MKIRKRNGKKGNKVTVNNYDVVETPQNEKMRGSKEKERLFKIKNTRWSTEN